MSFTARKTSPAAPQDPIITDRFLSAESGLRTILETVLLDTMYELPSMRNVGKVVIDETVIEGQTQPYIVYRSDAATPAIEEPRRASGSNHH